MGKKVILRSWGSRLAAAVVGSLFGFVLITGSFFFVFWNEGHGLHTAMALRETGKELVSVPTAPISEQNNLHPVYFTGLATTSEVLRDSLLDVSQQALILERHVLMYQWQEQTETDSETHLGGSESEVKTYSYNSVWSPQLIKSHSFKEPEGHQNPSEMPYTSRIFQAQKVKVGDFSLPPDFVKKMKGATMLDLSRLDLLPLQKKFNKPVQHLDYGLYVGNHPDQPEIGDLKITVTEILPQTVSVIAQQTGKTVQAYATRFKRSVALLEMGAQSPDQMIQEAERENVLLTWAFRGLTFLMMWLGFALILRPLVILADILPLLGDLVGFGVGLLALLGGLLLWALATAIAWFAVRPFWALGLLALILLFSYILFTHRDTPDHH